MICGRSLHQYAVVLYIAIMRFSGQVHVLVYVRQIYIIRQNLSTIIYDLEIFGTYTAWPEKNYKKLPFGTMTYMT